MKEEPQGSGLELWGLRKFGGNLRWEVEYVHEQVFSFSLLLHLNILKSPRRVSDEKLKKGIITFIY
ncbi:MAG: hypothetical protein ACFE9Z_01600 [Promethearchaeota archaeon]